MHKMYKSGTATEDLINMTVCIIDGGKIKKPKSSWDLDSKSLVVVCSVPKMGELVQDVVIRKGDMVRYRELKNIGSCCCGKNLVMI